MTAEIRRLGQQVWVVDLACAIEECWQTDLVGAGMRAEVHNESHHDLQADAWTDRDLLGELDELSSSDTEPARV